MNPFALAAQEIIKTQATIIGPIAWEQAQRVSEIKIVNKSVTELKGNPKVVLEKLVKIFADFFGQASVEVCKDAIREMKPQISSSELPDILK